MLLLSAITSRPYFLLPIPLVKYQEEKILSDREKKVRQLKDALAPLVKQLDKHESGASPLDADRIKSIKMRWEKYQKELEESSRPLSPDVSILLELLLLKHTGREIISELYASR